VLFFDLDETLLDHDGAERQAALLFAEKFQLAGVDDESFVDRWRAVSEAYMDQFLAGELTFEDQRRLRVGSLLGRKLEQREAANIFRCYLDEYEARWRLYPDVLPLVLHRPVEVTTHFRQSPIR